MIYLDNAATTPVTTQIAVAVMEALVSYYGNPESPHSVGRSANEEIFKARKQICKLFGQDAPSQVIFTSGGTEANNLAILGLKKYLQETGKTHIITSKTEHKSVLLAIERLEEEGFDVTYISPGKEGRVTAQMVKDAIREDTGLVSIMYINNETGCINDVAGIQKAIKEAGDILFHCDCVQAVGYYDLKEVMADMISVSAHKFNGPKGIGCLFVRSAETLPLLQSVLCGGEQEMFLRPGTLNTAGVIGFSTATKYLPLNPVGWQECIMTRLLNEKVTGFHRNFAQSICSPRIGSYRFDGIDGETLVAALSLRGLCVSTGAACNSNSVEPSYVLIESGLTPEEASETIRVSFSNETSEEELETAANIIADAVNFLRSRDAEE